MKFLVIKDLNNDALDDKWLAAMQTAYNRDRSKFLADYQLLVKSIAKLQVIESTLRREILHQDDSAQLLKNLASAFLPTSQVARAASVLDVLRGVIIPLFDSALPSGLAGKSKLQ